MSELNSDARTLLDRSKDVGTPDAAAVARVRASVMSSIAMPMSIDGIAKVAKGAAKQVPCAAAPKSIFALPLLGKVLGGVALVTALASGRALWPSPRSVPRTPTSTSLTETSPSTTATALELLATAPSSITAPKSKIASPKKSPIDSRSPSAAETTSTLSQDVANLREAQAALVANDPHHALLAADRVDATGATCRRTRGRAHCGELRD